MASNKKRKGNAPLTNPAYIETEEGYVRNPEAPDAQHQSRIDWNRMNSVQDAQIGVEDLRKKQDAINEEYRKRKG